MDDTLIEAVARAAHDHWMSLSGAPFTWDALPDQFKALHLDRARSVLAAIEASGTHVVVPAEPTQQMIGDGEFFCSYEGRGVETIYAAMLAARSEQIGRW